MHYYFHLRIGTELSRDELGLNLPDLNAAYLEAFRAAREMWGELLLQRSNPMIRSFEIADQDDRLLLTVPFREVLDNAQTRTRRIPEVARSVAKQWHAAQALADSHGRRINDIQKTIEVTRKTLQETKQMAELLAPFARRQ